jgi:hypothetical protein
VPGWRKKRKKFFSTSNWRFSDGKIDVQKILLTFKVCWLDDGTCLAKHRKLKTE